MSNKNITIIMVVVVLVLPLITAAQTDIPRKGVELNVEYPQLGGVDPNQDRNVPSIIAWIYYFGIALGAFLAVAMIAYGGFQYIMSFGNPTAAGEGKDRIKMALFGFLLLLFAIIALKTINPAILDTFVNGLSIEPAEVTPEESGGGTTP